MNSKLKLMCVLAHPDDESLGNGGTLAKYAAEGVETYVLCATRGERGRFGIAAERPSDEVVGKVRESELRDACKELGVREVIVLDYLDKELDQANSKEAIALIATQLRRIKPQVVITFSSDGSYGHPDHIAISQFTTAAIVSAADSGYRTDIGERAHRVDKLYCMSWTKAKMDSYVEAFRDIKITVDGRERGVVAWPDWQITTVINTELFWEQAWRAIQCHKTQLSIYEKLATLSPESHKKLWGTQEYYRMMSTVNGGRKIETDLFEGLR